MTLSLPIPGKKKLIKFFFIPYHINIGYLNHSGEVHMRESESIADLRAEV
jgi:hypothetical protein